MKPLMNKEEITKIESLLEKDDVVLEWGSGGSTVYFPRFVKEYYSIEHNDSWFKAVKKERPDNVKYYKVPQNKPRTRPTKRSEFKDYVEKVHDFDRKFDKVLIDGRARKYCAKEVLPYLKRDSLVFLHDFFHRTRYHEVLQWYEEVDSADSLIVLKRREKWEEKK